MQPSQRAVPFGWAWYCTAFCDILLDAKAGVIAYPPTEIAAAPVAARRIISRRECFEAIGSCVMLLFPRGFVPPCVSCPEGRGQARKLPRPRWGCSAERSQTFPFRSQNVPGKFGKQFRAHLVHHCSAVVFDGALADAKIGGDVLARVTGQNHIHYLMLARSQICNMACGSFLNGLKQADVV